jgi:hypothetical protein
MGNEAEIYTWVEKPMVMVGMRYKTNTKSLEPPAEIAELPEIDAIVSIHAVYGSALANAILGAIP